MKINARHLMPARRAPLLSFRAAASLILAALAFSAVSAIAQDKPAAVPSPAKPPANAGPDLAKPTLYVVGYAHLDTEWR